MRRREARLICVVVVAAFLLLQASPARSAREVRRVLIINDLGIISSPGFAEIDQAILAGLQKSPYRIELYEESLDLSLFPDRVSQDKFREEIIQKYSARKPDVIIAAGPVSLKFIAELYDKFQGTPIIFCAIWGGIPGQLRHGVPFTGVLAQLHPEGTLNAALHLLPSTKHVVVVGGMGKFDEGFEAITKQSFHNYESKLEFTYLFDLTMPALLERLKHLPSDTIVYHTAISQDAAGDHFIDSAQAIPMVASAADAPVFVMDDVDLRAGTVGGDLVNWADDGRIAAEMAATGSQRREAPGYPRRHQQPCLHVRLAGAQALGDERKEPSPRQHRAQSAAELLGILQVVHHQRDCSDLIGGVADWRTVVAAGETKEGGSQSSPYL